MILLSPDSTCDSTKLSLKAYYLLSILHFTTLLPHKTYISAQRWLFFSLPFGVFVFRASAYISERRNDCSITFTSELLHTLTIITTEHQCIISFLLLRYSWIVRILRYINLPSIK